MFGSTNRLEEMGAESSQWVAKVQHSSLIIFASRIIVQCLSPVLDLPLWCKVAEHTIQSEYVLDM